MEYYFSILLSDLELISQNSISAFGFRERMKLERTLFIILQKTMYKVLNYEVQGFTNFYRNELKKKVTDLDKDKRYHVLIDKIFDLKFFLQSLSSDSAYVRGDTLSKAGANRNEIFSIIKAHVKGIIEQVRLLDDMNSTHKLNVEHPIKKILIIGASGSGTTTTGKKLSDSLNFPFIDLDDLFWIQTFPPYKKYRSLEELQKVVTTEILEKDKWILSGSPCGWGDTIIPHLDLVVFLIVPTEERIKRITERAKKKYGSEILLGGSMYNDHSAFVEWSQNYDNGGITGRTRNLHEQWLKYVSCEVLRIEGIYNFDYTTNEIINHINGKV